MKKAIPWASVGFVVGIAAGFAYGRKAKQGITDSVSTDFSGGVLSVRVDTLQAARSGLPDVLNAYLNKSRG